MKPHLHMPGKLRTVVLLLLLLIGGRFLSAYSVLTHEEIIDLAWTTGILPLLQARYPGLTDDQIREAHAYAYGGAVIQDLGYYPFGSAEFSDLAHYARSGDFVLELLRESEDPDEYAFSLGALSHYAADIAGHPAVNQAVAIEYPKLRARFGKSVRYAQDKTAHLKTEFGFDMAQVAQKRYAPQQYHDFIGFKVSKPLLERVFPVVYGLNLQDILPHEDLAIGTFRYSVSKLIPHMTQVALRTHKKELIREIPNFDRRRFLYRLSRSDYEREWGRDYDRPGLGTRLVAAILSCIPKIGPLKAMDFRNPTPRTEDMYFKSINLTVDQYGALLGEERARRIKLPNLDLDSGELIAAGEYSLADKTYAKLVAQLQDGKFAMTNKALRANIVAFYSAPASVLETEKDPAQQKTLQESLDQLESFVPVDTQTKP